MKTMITQRMMSEVKSEHNQRMFVKNGVVNGKECLSKHCPVFKQICRASKCSAWNTVNKDTGYCKWINK